MEILPVAESDSYVVMGGQGARHMGMDESAEGFHILSNTLYKHKKLAAIREPLCNAVDAHIEAGVDLPVEVTITNDKVEITDFGKGIHDSKIIAIYGTYFASTKKKDNRQTGGFGLGSKAPFAYTDHFIVTSRHDGEANTYAVHIGSEDTDGVPAIRPMNKRPTTETGVTVQFPVAGASDAAMFVEMVKSLAWIGGMKIRLNGQLLDCIDLPQLQKQGFCLMGKTMSSHIINQDHMALIGNVAYPIVKLPELVPFMQKIESYRCNGYSQFLFYCPPGSARPVPSREGLSYNKQTIATLVEVMQKAVNAIKREQPQAFKTFLNDRFDAIKPTRLTIPDFFSRDDHPGRSSNPIPNAVSARHPVLFDTKLIAAQYEERQFRNRHFDMKRIGAFLGRRIRGHKKPMLQAIRREGNGSYYIAGAMQKEANALAMRLLARAALRSGVFANLHKRHVGNWNGPALQHIKLKDKYSSFNPHVSDLTTIRVAWHTKQARSIGVESYVLIRSNRLTEKQIGDFEAECKKFGFTLKYMDKPVVVPVVKKPKVIAAEKPEPLYKPLVLGRMSDYRSHQAFVISNEPDSLIKSPKFYLATGGGYECGSPFARLPKNHEGLHDLIAGARIGSTAITIGVKETHEAIKNGVADLRAHVLEMALERLKKVKGKKPDPDENLYISAAHHMLMRHYAPDGNTDVAAARLMMRNRRFVHLAYNRPYKADPAKDEVYQFWILAFTLLGSDARNRDYHPTDTEREFYKTYCKQHDQFYAATDPRCKAFKKANNGEFEGFLQRLLAFNWRFFMSKTYEEIVAILEFMAKFQRQQKKGDEE